MTLCPFFGNCEGKEVRDYQPSPSVDEKFNKSGRAAGEHSYTPKVFRCEIFRRAGLELAHETSVLRLMYVRLDGLLSTCLLCVCVCVCVCVSE